MVSKELTAASSRPLVLSILRSGESYGYEILQRIKILSQNQVAWTDGMLYPVLHRLEKNGLIKARWSESDAGRRRKYYRLTAKGRKVLDEDMVAWQTVNRMFDKIYGASLCIS